MGSDLLVSNTIEISVSDKLLLLFEKRSIAEFRNSIRTRGRHLHKLFNDASGYQISKNYLPMMCIWEYMNIFIWHAASEPRVIKVTENHTWLRWRNKLTIKQAKNSPESGNFWSNFAPVIKGSSCLALLWNCCVWNFETFLSDTVKLTFSSFPISKKRRLETMITYETCFGSFTRQMERSLAIRTLHFNVRNSRLNTASLFL